MGNQQVNDKGVPIPFAKEYLVSESGEVYSIKHGRNLKTSEVTGYFRVWLTTNEGKKSQYLVHRVVAITYLPNHDNKEQVNHKDGNKKNNHISNLEWVSRRENMQHAFTNGLNSNLGEKNGKARLTESEVLEIYKLCLDGKSNGEVAELFSVTKNMVNLIKCKRTWTHILQDLPDVQTQNRSARLTKEQKAEATFLRESGKTSKEVATIMGITLNQAESVTRTTR